MAAVTKSSSEMLGEFLREAAVLVFVFGFLDLPSIDRSRFGFIAGVVYGVSVIVVSALFLWMGMRVELDRKAR